MKIPDASLHGEAYTLPKIAIVIALATLVLLPAATQAAPLGGAINVVNYAFQDAATGLPISVVSGSPVTWTGVSGVHTVTAEDGSFDSGMLLPGQTFTATPGAGAYTYVCLYHPTMRGTIVVA